MNETTEVRSVCELCSASCGVIIKVVDGKPTEIVGNPVLNPLQSDNRYKPIYFPFYVLSCHVYTSSLKPKRRVLSELVE